MVSCQRQKKKRRKKKEKKESKICASFRIICLPFPNPEGTEFFLGRIFPQLILPFWKLGPDGSICKGFHAPEAYTYTELALLRRPNADSHSALNSPEFVRSNPRRFEYLLVRGSFQT